MGIGFCDVSNGKNRLEHGIQAIFPQHIAKPFRADLCAYGAERRDARNVVKLGFPIAGYDQRLGVSDFFGQQIFGNRINHRAQTRTDIIKIKRCNGCAFFCGVPGLLDIGKNFSRCMCNRRPKVKAAFTWGHFRYLVALLAEGQNRLRFLVFQITRRSIIL